MKNYVIAIEETVVQNFEVKATSSGFVFIPLKEEHKKLTIVTKKAVRTVM